MNEYVKMSVQSRADFFEKHYTVPAEVQPDVDAFLAQLNQLGEQCADAAAFEAQFAAGLSETFNNLLLRCTPNAYQMSAEESARVEETKAQMFEEDREAIEQKIVDDIEDHIKVEAKEELFAASRKAMIGAGVFDEYSRVSNAVDDASRLGGFLGGLFKKKKDK